MIDIDALDEQFGLEGELGFVEQEGGLVFISVYNKYAEAEISLYGGHVTRFTPHDTFDVIWMSPASQFEEGKPIRGGIPVCFPWFGPHSEDASLPLHGFARIVYWEVVETASLPGGETQLVLQLTSSQQTKQWWPYDFQAKLEIRVGKQLVVNLHVENTGREPFTYTAALHTYYNVSEIGNVSIEGLANTPYYNGMEKVLHVQDEALLTIGKEENRRYIETTAACLLHDQAFKRTIKAGKTGSEATVVWNPWRETCASIPDLADDDYQTFVCIEAANIYHDAVKVFPGENHVTGVEIGAIQHRATIGRSSDESGFSIV